MTETLPKLFITDVDGTLTDGGVYYGAIEGPSGGFVMKRFDVHDGYAFTKLKNKGIVTCWLTSEQNSTDNNAVGTRARSLGIDHMIFAGDRSKLEIAKELCTQYGITLEDVAFVGDSENDFDLLSSCGDPFCPQDAHERIREIHNITVLEKRGGFGCIREITDKIYGL